MIRQFIDFDYYENTYEALNAKQLKACPENNFNYFAKQASSAIYDHIIYQFTTLEQIADVAKRLAIQHATAMLVEHYYTNGTNFANVRTNKTTDGVTQEIEYIEGFNPSVIPQTILNKLTNENLYYTLFSEGESVDEAAAVEVVTDQDIIITSARPNLINKTQFEVNEYFDGQLISQGERLTEVEGDLSQLDDNYVNITEFEDSQVAQDTIIEATRIKADQNRELIFAIETGLEAGGVAQAIFRSPQDDNDLTVGRVLVANGTPVNNNAPVLIAPTRPNILTYTQETGFKTFDFKANGSIAIGVAGDISRASTTGAVRFKVELVDYVGGATLDTIYKTFEFTTQVKYESQIGTLRYNISNIDSTIIERRFFLRYSVETVNGNLYIEGGGEVIVDIQLSGGVASVSTSDDVINVSEVDGGNVSSALNTLKNGVDNNAIDIAANTANIATNTADIATNTTNIATNTANIATNTSDIAQAKQDILDNTADIASNTANIGTNTLAIAANAADISQLQDDVANIDVQFTDGVNVGDVAWGDKLDKISTGTLYTSTVDITPEGIIEVIIKDKTTGDEIGRLSGSTTGQFKNKVIKNGESIIPSWVDTEIDSIVSKQSIEEFVTLNTEYTVTTAVDSNQKSHTNTVNLSDTNNLSIKSFLNDPSVPATISTGVGMLFGINTSTKSSIIHFTEYDRGGEETGSAYFKANDDYSPVTKGYLNKELGFAGVEVGDGSETGVLYLIA